MILTYRFNLILTFTELMLLDRRKTFYLSRATSARSDRRAVRAVLRRDKSALEISDVSTRTSSNFSTGRNSRDENREIKNNNNKNDNLGAEHSSERRALPIDIIHNNNNMFARDVHFLFSKRTGSRTARVTHAVEYILL